MTDAEGIRLQKVLAAAGVGSRRACEQLIAEGRVSVDGEKVREQGMRVDPAKAVVRVDGMRVTAPTGMVHLALNKPVGMVTAMTDPEGRPTVGDLVVGRRERLFHVGRLDADTEGLLLLTNDGELAHRLTHPSRGVEKEYLVEVVGSPSRGALRALREGVELEDGRTAPAKASAVAPGVLRLVIHEGRNRQVRRMCEAIGHPVTRLVRTRIGPLTDTRLAPGEWRQLTPEEVAALARAAAGPADVDG